MHGKITINYSPNFSRKKRTKRNINFIVFHYTGMNSQSKAIKRLINVNSKVSCHYFIKKNGNIVSMVPDDYPAWHAGISKWKNFKFLNKISLGIEIQNKGHKFGYHNFSKKQISSVIKLSRFLMKKYNIKKKNILGHSDIAYERKIDPGEKFPWKYLSQNNIGIWHNLSNKNLKSLRKAKTNKIEKKNFLRYLRKIGYNVKNLNLNLKLIKSFQRRFRIALIDGKIDKECYFIAKNLSKY